MSTTGTAVPSHCGRDASGAVSGDTAPDCVVDTGTCDQPWAAAIAEDDLEKLAVVSRWK